ncbi:MAG: glycosyltransferase family 4 protein, partial [Terriglobia bacterium]|nr:glycosyltransferase family 4 protein [Terriglobia bacterium]
LGPGISVVGTKTFSFTHKKFGRIVSYLSYLVGAIWHGFRVQGPDIYVTLTTPPLLPIIGSVLSTLRRARHVLWEMDVYPDIATDVCFFKKNGMIDRLVGAVLDWSRRRADTIVVLGDDMKARLLARGISEAKIRVVENWADGVEITPLPFPAGPLVIQYSGNFGMAHEAETITGVIERLQNHPDFQFMFVGGGSKRPALMELCRAKDIRNVEFREYCDRADLGKNLAKGHLGLVTQLPQTVGSVVPSKIYGIMAAGRPLLYIGPDHSTPARHVHRFNSGWHIQPGDIDGLEQLLLRLNQNRHLLAEAGARARTAFDQSFDRPIGIARMLEVLEGKAYSSESVPKLSESTPGD